MRADVRLDPTSYSDTESRSREAIFISYATEDEDFVVNLFNRLERNGFEVWYQRLMSPGKDYTAEIDDRLDRCRAGIVVWSRSSVANINVKSEATHLQQRGCLIPILIEDCRPTRLLSLIQAIKCKPDRQLRQVEFCRLIMYLKRHIENRILPKPPIKEIVLNTERYKHHNFTPVIIGVLLGVSLVLGAKFGLHLKENDYEKQSVGEFEKLSDIKNLTADDIKADSKFPDAVQLIDFAIGVRNLNNDWTHKILMTWRGYYNMERRFATKYCRELNDFKRMAYQRFEKADVTGRIEIPRSKSSEAGKYITEPLRIIGESDFKNRVWQMYRCPGDEAPLFPGVEDQVFDSAR